MIKFNFITQNFLDIPSYKWLHVMVEVVCIVL